MPRRLLISKVKTCKTFRLASLAICRWSMLLRPVLIERGAGTPRLSAMLRWPQMRRVARAMQPLKTNCVSGCLITRSVISFRKLLSKSATTRRAFYFPELRLNLLLAWPSLPRSRVTRMPLRIFTISAHRTASGTTSRMHLVVRWVRRLAVRPEVITAQMASSPAASVNRRIFWRSSQ